MAEIVAASAMTEAGVSKRVALKRIRTASSADPQFVARFFDEVRLAMQLSHANVVQVFDFGRTEADEFFLAMEFVEGVDLQRLRRVAGQRTPAARRKRCTSSAQMLRGLDYAHRRTDSDDRPLGIVHLDVKPANVLLSFEGEVKLTDFGVARSRDARRPTVGISGTIPFMSPEQTRGEAIDLRSDVFSAGVLLYTLLAGDLPVRRGRRRRDAVRDPALPLSARCPASNRASASSRCCGALCTASPGRSLPERRRVRRRDRRADVRAGLARRRGRAARSAAGGVPARARAAERAVRARQAPRGARGHARRQPPRRAPCCRAFWRRRPARPRPRARR